MKLARLPVAAALALAAVASSALLPTTVVAATPTQKAVAGEEKDRLAREKRELTERTELLKKQLETSQKLIAEKEAMRKQLLAEIAALKAGKK